MQIVTTSPAQTERKFGEKETIPQYHRLKKVGAVDVYQNDIVVWQLNEGPSLFATLGKALTRGNAFPLEIWRNGKNLVRVNSEQFDAWATYDFLLAKNLELEPLEI